MRSLLLYTILFGIVSFSFVNPAYSQCENPTVNLPDASHDVDGTIDNGYCVTLSFDSGFTGFPTGIGMDLTHTFQGDLGITVIANGNLLNVMQRPGAMGNCSGGCPCGDASNIGGSYTFEDGNTNDPENGLAAGGGSYGVTADDDCNIGTPGINSFADLWGSYTLGDVVTATICITDHAGADVGVASDITFLFPNPVECGCTDPSALNFDPDASVDDGSCIYDCPDLGLTVAQDYFEFCAGDANFTLASNVTTSEPVDFEWTADNGADIYIDNPFSSNTSVSFPPDESGTFTFTITVTDEFFCQEDIDVIVNIGAPPDVDIDGPTEACPGDLVELNLIGGPYASIYWPETGDDTETVFVEAGTHEVIVEDAFGCQNTATWVIDAFTPYEHDIFGPDEICAENGEATLEVDPFFNSYEWSTGDDTPTIIVTEAGYYDVTIEDENGCFAEATFFLPEADPVEVEILGDLEVCQGEFSFLEATFGFAEYEWSTGEQGPDIYAYDSDIYTVTVTDYNGCVGEADFEVLVNELEPPIIDGGDVLCAGQDLVLSIDPIYSYYDWSTGDDTPSITITEPDFITVTVTDANNCTAEAEIDVIPATPIIADIQGDLVICPGESTTLTATAGFASYTWLHNNATTNQVTIDQAGEYSVLITNGDNCSETITTLVIEQPNPTPQISGDDHICFGETTTLTVTETYNAYAWSNTSTDAQITLDQAGTYTVTVTDNEGCEGIASFDLTASPDLTPTIDGVLDICPDESTVLTSSADATLMHSWSPGGANGTQLTVNAAGTYTLTVEDDAACTATASVTVNQFDTPQAEILGDLILCENEVSTLSLSENFDTYTWSNNTSQPTIDIDQAGTYGVTVTDVNGCTAQDEVVAQAIDISVEITGDQAICAGEQTTFSVPDQFDSYQWSSNATINTITANTTGTYSVTVSDVNGCMATDDIDLVVNELPVVEIEGRLSFCPEGATEITATEGYVTYAWSNGENSATILVDEQNTYTVTVTDANGCENTASVFVEEQAELDVAILGDLTFCDGLSTELSIDAPYAAYDWSVGNANTATLTVNETTTVSVTVTDDFGCTGSDEVMVEALALPTPQITGSLDYCAGLSTDIGTGVYASYDWSVSNVDTQFVTITTPGPVNLTVVDEHGCIGSTSTLVIENPLPVHQIQGIPGFCPDESTILSGQEGYIAYQWSTNSSAASITVDQTQTYELSVTDDNGCIGVASIDVAEYATEIPQIQGVNQFCPGTSTDLQATGSFVSYTWNTGEESATITADAVDTYTVFATDANNCVTENSIDVTEYIVVAPTIDAVDGFCNGLTADLTATAGYSSYAWSPTTGANNVLTVDEGGVYEVAVIDMNGCASDAAIAITEYDLPTPQIGGSLTFCTGLSTTLNAGATYVDYNWSSGETAAEVEINTPGTIGLTVTDDNGCVGSTNEFVNEADELSPVISGELDYCFGDSTTLDAGNGFATYAWSNASGESSIVVTAPGTYSVYVTDAGGCDGTAEVEVVENALPIPAIDGELAYCAGLETTLSADQTYASYTWSTTAPTADITVDQPGQYALTVVDDNDCVNQVSVVVEELPLPVFDIQGDLEFCITASTDLSVQPAYAAYEWSIGGDQQTVNWNQAGVVAVTVTDSFGCQEDQNVQLATVALPIADAGAEMILDCNVLEVTLGGQSNPTNGHSYLWSGPGITAANETSLHPTINLEGTYTLQVTNDAFACPSLPVTVAVENHTFEPVVALEVLDVIDCITDIVEVDARDSETASSFIYQWFDQNMNPIDGANELVYNASTAQVYTFQVIDTITGCSNMNNIEVEENTEYPFAEAGDPQILNCDITVATLNGSASQSGGQIEYTWTTPDGAFVGATNESDVNVNEPAWYYLQVEDVINGCGNIDSVYVDQNVEYPIAQTSEDFELNCLDPQTTLSGQGSSLGNQYAYQWFNGNASIENANQLLLSVDGPGTYVLEVENIENGCTSRDDVLITLNDAEPEVLNFITDTPTCEGDADGAIILAGVDGGTTPYMYSFNGQPYSPSTAFNNLASGEYEVIVEDAIGCTLRTVIEVNDGNDLGLDLGHDQYLEEGELANVIGEPMNVDEQDIVSINWTTLANLPCEDCLHQFDLALEESTQFFLEITDVNGCVAKDNVTVFINKERPIYVPTAFSPNGDEDNDIFFIYSGIEDLKISSFLVFNRWGETVFEVYNSFPNDPRWGWDGMHRGQTVNAAVYVWVAEVEFPNGDVEVIKGDVMIMR